MKQKSKKFETLKGFIILDMGIIKGGANSGCSATDNDKLCNGWCPTAGCAHDGCCGDNYDSGGDTACSNSGKENAIFFKYSPTKL